MAIVHSEMKLSFSSQNAAHIWLSEREGSRSEQKRKLDDEAALELDLGKFGVFRKLN